MSVLGKTFLNSLSKISSACPYTLGAKKLFGIVKGQKQGDNVPASDKERHLRGMAKLGIAISLVGVFCPIFWISFFMGVRGEQLYYNAMHSGLVVLFGLGFYAKYRFDLRREVEKRNGTVNGKETI